MKKCIILLTSLAILMVFIAPVSPVESQPHMPDEAQIIEFLNAHPLVGGAGAEVLDVVLMRGALVIDLSESVLPEGVYDEALFTQLQADLDEAFNINLFFMTTFKVEGKPLEFWGHPIPDFDSIDLPEIRELPGDGPLAGVRIALSPGHGRYWNETYAAWMWQRLLFFGIREDIINAEIMRYVKAALENQGATVIQLRELDFNSGIGVTGLPTWQEATRQYAIAQGLPSWVWDGSSTNYNSDIRARPYMANYYGADIFISLHNNGWNGTMRGTETYWDINNHPGSSALAYAVHNSVIQAIRTQDPTWTDRGVKSTDWSYGEIYFAQMPAILLELAFMDNEEDNTWLKQDANKVLAANAITQGICNFYDVVCEDVPLTLPRILEEPELTPTLGTGMCDSGWYSYPNERGQFAYLALNATEPAQQSHLAAWQPALPAIGEYRLEVFIPGHGAIPWECPSMTVNGDTTRAVYEVTHANGTSTIPIRQSVTANQWVDLGIFHFNDPAQARVTLSNVTGEAYQTTTVSASAMRFTLVGNAHTLFYNTAWVADPWLTQEVNAPLEYLQHFMGYHHTCFDQDILDSDGVLINIPQLIHNAAVANQINPKLLLAIMEAEHSALSVCPDSLALSTLMGLEPASTARQQIGDAATLLRTAIDTLNNPTGTTPNGWSIGVPKVTLDGVSVTPANQTITILFDYTQNAGAQWGGNVLEERGVLGIYTAFRDYQLNSPLFIGMNPIFFPVMNR